MAQMDYSTDKSEFNFAISYLNRLNMLFYQALQAADELNAFKWHGYLLSLYRELSTHMKPTDEKAIEDRLFALLDKVQQQSITNANIGSTAIEISLYKELHAIEKELRKILKDAGLETKLAEDARKAIR